MHPNRITNPAATDNKFANKSLLWGPDAVRTVADVIERLPRPNSCRLPTPNYTGTGEARKVFLAVEAMRRHTADAGWQLQTGLEQAGYQLWGYNFDGVYNNVDVIDILDLTEPNIVVLQDKREWESKTASQRLPEMRFENVGILRKRDDIFKLTVLKDAHAKPDYHRQSAEEAGIHAWITYYHPAIVQHVAPYLRAEHCIRTSHSINPRHVPAYSGDRVEKAIISGATSPVYPLRKRIIQNLRSLPSIEHKGHPGYHAKGCVTPEYLQTLAKYRVSIATSSYFGYALRKIIEGTVCGCIVITDLPVDDVLPVVEENLVRVSPNISFDELHRRLRKLYSEYNPDRQEDIAKRAIAYYDYRVVGLRLAKNIEQLRRIGCA